MMFCANVVVAPPDPWDPQAYFALESRARRSRAMRQAERRAIQLGLRGETLRAFATSELLEVTDMTSLIVEQRRHIAREHWPHLQTPIEHPYMPANSATALAIELDARSPSVAAEPG